VIHVPILRRGEPYKSLDTDTVVHFSTGEPMAEVSQANPGLIDRDLRKSAEARAALLDIPCADLIAILKNAAELFMTADLPLGDDTQSPDDFVRQQSGSTGLPEHMCRKNMEKNHFVLTQMEPVLDGLTRGLDLRVLDDGYGEDDAGRMLSYMAESDVLGLVLPSNSPGVHALWLPVLALKVGLVLKPGPQEPWTPYRMAQAFFKAGIPIASISLYPGGPDAGAAVLRGCERSVIFGGTPTVERYATDSSVQAHGPGFSKIFLGDDCVDDWERYLDVMVDSVLINSGRSCISCSGVWVSRHGREIAEAMAERLGPVAPKPPSDPDSALAAFTNPAVAEQISATIDKDLAAGGEDVTAKYRDGARLVSEERCAYLRPTLIYCDSPEPPLANTEYMFPFVSVVACPQDQMLERSGGTLVGTCITGDEGFIRRAIGSRKIDRLNIGPIPTIKINWLQPHEGNLVDFLMRPRAFQKL
jgi:acyl-CoA reductase-like NAD-dependent aldehyde dehydrogenase